MAQRNRARIAAGLVLGAIALVLAQRRRRRANRGPCPLQEGHGRHRRRPLRRGHRGAEEGVRHPSAPERPLQHCPRVRRYRATSRTLSSITRSTSEGRPRIATRSRRSSRTSRRAFASSRRARSSRSRCRPPAPAPVRAARRAPGAGAGPPVPRGRRGHRSRDPGSRRARSRSRADLKTEEVFEETVVTASRAAQSPLDAPNSTSIITEQDIRLSGITQIPELLRRLAGVDIMETTGAQTEVSLRGFNQRLSNKVLVLVDGRSVYVDLLGATFWAVPADRRRGHRAHRGRPRPGLGALRRRRVQRRHQHHHQGARRGRQRLQRRLRRPQHDARHGLGERPRQGARRTASRPATTTCRAGAARCRRAAPTSCLSSPDQDTSDRTVRARRRGHAPVRQGRHRRRRGRLHQRRRARSSGSGRSTTRS